MVCKNTSPNAAQRGASLAEMVVALGLSSMLLITLSTIYLHSARSFSVMENHIELDNASRLAMDAIGREIRSADQLVAYDTNKLTFRFGTDLVSYSYNPATKVLLRETASGAKVLLENCDFIRYEIFQRTPYTGSYGFFPAATPASCKLVRVTWLCSRSLLGQVNNQTTMRSSQIVLRNQKL